MERRAKEKDKQAAAQSETNGLIVTKRLQLGNVVKERDKDTTFQLVRHQPFGMHL